MWWHGTVSTLQTGRPWQEGFPIFQLDPYSSEQVRPWWRASIWADCWCWIREWQDLQTALSLQSSSLYKLYIPKSRHRDTLPTQTITEITTLWGHLLSTGASWSSAKKPKPKKPKSLPALPLGTQLLRNALIWTSTSASANPSPKPIKSGDPSKLTSADLNRMESVLSRPNL